MDPSVFNKEDSSTTIKDKLLEQLKNCTTSLTTETQSKDVVILDDTPHAAELCFILEKILQHGIKERGLFGIGMTVFWEFLEKLEECVPRGECEEVLSICRDCSSTSIGRARIFIKASLNSNSFSDYISALSWNTSLLHNFYKPFALLRSEEHAPVFLTLCESLSKLKFSLFYKDKDLEKLSYWSTVPQLLSRPKVTPTPSSSSSPQPIQSPPLPSSVESQPSLPNSSGESRFKSTITQLSNVPLPPEAESETVQEDELVARKPLRESKGIKKKKKSRRTVVSIEEDDNKDEHAASPQSMSSTPQQLSVLSNEERTSSVAPSSSSSTTPIVDIVDIVDTVKKETSSKSTDLMPTSSAGSNNKSKALQKDNSGPSLEFMSIDDFEQEDDSSDTTSATNSAANSMKSFSTFTDTIEDIAALHSSNGNKHIHDENKYIHDETSQLLRDGSKHKCDSMPLLIHESDLMEPADPVMHSPPTSSSSSNVAFHKDYHHVETYNYNHNVHTETDNNNNSSNEHEFSASNSFRPRTDSRVTAQVVPVPVPSSSSVPISVSVPLVTSSLPTSSSSNVDIQRQRKDSIHTTSIGSFTEISDYNYKSWSQSAPSSTHPSTYSSSQGTVTVVQASRFTSPFEIIEDYIDNVPDNYDTTEEQKKSSSKGPSNFIQDIPPKLGVAKSNATCAECNAPLPTGMFSQVRYDYYNGLYYCKNCHRNDLSVIPARVIHRGDRRQYKVSVHSKLHIVSNYSRPLINIGMLNPRLYDWDLSLKKIQGVRTQMTLLADIIRTCRNSASLLEVLNGREYLLDSVHIYSLRDLIESKSLLQILYHVMEKYILHITKSCETCRGKGFVCELCNSKEPIFMFQLNSIGKCGACSTIFHKECIKKSTPFVCPKCERIKKIRK